jgi:integrase
MAKLNEMEIKALAAPAKGVKLYYFPDAVLQGKRAPRGFAVRVTANNVRSFVVRYRNRAHVERLYTIGQYPDWSVLKAVEEARVIRQRIDKGEDPLGDRRKVETAAKDTLESITAEYFKREGNGLKSAARVERALSRLVLPTLGKRDIHTIKRSEIIRLLDQISDESGPIMANRTKAYLSRIFTWFAGRSDEFRSPIVKGMGFSSADEEPRQRNLDDDEIRSVWRTAEGPYGALCKFLLLTGARRSEAVGMTWDELKDGVWLLPADAGPERNKVGLPLVRPLSQAALDVLPTRGEGPFVFSTTGGRTPISSLWRHHAALLKASGTSDWRRHDLRRTSRTLLGRAKVPTDFAEKCLGHVEGKIRKTYDCWEYKDEKAAAYAALASLIDRILNPPADNVMPLVRHG